ncbi:MAG: AAA family ATPase [Clostridia bacterium]|nr:AAA family ATPase [Clostridia bacterium]
MKLIKCHAENFGKLTAFSYNFESGLNVINENNGWGKTTFANFLKAMFYGLEKTGKRSLDENVRKRYEPWNNGNFGGNVDFEVNGKTYRIERFFGKKESDDTFALYDLKTGKLSSDYTENIGEELFGLDAEAFERTAFIPQKALDTGVNESIVSRLNSLLHGTDETTNFESAIERLKERKKRLSNQQKTGVIDKLDKQITEKELEISGLNAGILGVNSLKLECEGLNVKTQSLKEEKLEIDNSVKKYGVLKEKELNLKNYNKLVLEGEKLQASVKELRAFFNNVDLTYKEIDEARSHYDNTVKKQTELFAKTENSYVEEKYEELSSYFSSGVPTSEQIIDLTNDLSRLNELKRIEKLGASYVIKKPSAKPSIIGGGVGLALILGGVLSLKITALSITLFALGGVLALGALAKYLYDAISYKNTVSKIPLLTHEERAELVVLNSRVGGFISKYESLETDYQKSLAVIMARLDDYQDVSKKHEVLEKECAILKEEMHDSKDKFESFLARYKVPYGLSYPEKFDYLKQMRHELAGKRIELDEKIKEIEEFKALKGVDLGVETSAVDIDELQKKARLLQGEIEDLERKKGVISQKIQNLETSAQKIGELEAELNLLNQDRQDYKVQFKYVSNAIDLLEKANESLCARFLAPVKNALTKYYSKLTGVNVDNLLLDADFNVSFEELGRQREVGYYSKGFKTALSLSMRLSLISALFENEKPYIVLDDPFVDLDGDKLKNALGFLKELESEYQIIYFTCHSSRVAK